MTMVSDELKDRIRKIKILMMDVDGVLTDGRIVLGNYGDELKFFDIHDGHGVVMLGRAGLKSVMITGRKSRISQKRAREMKVSKVYQNAHDKLKVYERALKKFGVTDEEVCYVGDDLIDVPVLCRVGFAVAVAGALPEVRRVVHYVTQRNGGRGAIREVTDLLLKTQGKWAEVTRRYGDIKEVAA